MKNSNRRPPPDAGQTRVTAASSQTTPIRWAVIGAGRFGAVHAEVLVDLPGVELVSLCRRSPAPLAALAQRLGVSRTATDYRRVLDDPDVDAVTIATHWQEHYEVAAAAIAAGKHVLLEKPIAATNDEAQRLVERALQAPTRFLVGHVCRFDPRVVLAKQAIDEGRLGRIVSMHARRNLPQAPGPLRLDRIPPLIGDGIHDVDLMLWFTGHRPARVYGRNVRAGDFRYADVGWAMIDLADDCLGVIETVWCLPTSTPFQIDARLEVIGTEGALYVDCANAGLAIHDARGASLADTQYWPRLRGQVHGALRTELEHFAESIRSGRPSDVITPREAANALAVVIAAEESAVSGDPTAAAWIP